jgi:O-antigen/teichoic acid export membrane protein
MESTQPRKHRQRVLTSVSFAGFEGLNQALTLALGLLVVRNMPTTEYGYYVICISAVGLCNSLASSGLSAGFRKIGGEVHEDKGRLSTLYISAVCERRLQSLFVLPVCVAIVGTLLWRQEQDVVKSLMLCLLVAANAAPELWRAISVEVLLLKSAWRRVQTQNLVGVLVRLLLIVPFLVFGLNAEGMLLVNAAAVWLIGWMTYRAASRMLALPAAESPKQRREIRTIMNRVMPNAVFSAGHQQLGTFLLASRGSVAAVADLGALTRLTSIFSIGVSAVAQVVAPKFSKTHAAQAMRRLYWGVLLLVAAVAAAVLAVTALFPAQLLWVLGPKYAHLQGPLLLAACLVMLQFAKAVTARMNQAKAWILRTAKWNIPFTLAAIGIGFLVLDTRTLDGVLTLMILSGLPMLTLYLADASAGLRAASRRASAHPSRRENS